jgi:hypothetical protein
MLIRHVFNIYVVFNMRTELYNVCKINYYNNNNHGSTALYGPGPPLASSFRGY